MKNISFSSYISNTDIQTSNLVTSNSQSPITSFFQCDDYKNSEGTICSKTIPDGYFILDTINKIIEQCHFLVILAMMDLKIITIIIVPHAKQTLH